MPASLLVRHFLLGFLQVKRWTYEESPARGT
jgi:hypothetical protein